MKKIIINGLLVVCIAVFGFSAYNLIDIYFEYKEIDEEYGEIAETYVEKKEEYLKIDWDGLIKRNEDVKGWIYIPDTKINYPVVQGKTNDDYIHSDIDKKSFRAGSIFIASENNKPFVDLNTVIYGHNMNNGSMFNNIKSYNEQDFADKHPYVYIYLPNKTVCLYKVFASHIIDATSSIYNTNETNIDNLLNEINKTNKLKVEISDKEKPIITLSTCVSGDENNTSRNVTHAILEKVVALKN